MKKIYNKSHNELIILPLICLCVLPAIYYFSLLYNAGDQVHYTKSYALVKNLNVFEAYNLYNVMISGKRFPHFIFQWIFGSAAIDKNVAMTFLNAILITYSYLILKKIGATNLVCFILIFTNYYFWVLYLTAETLKIGLIFFLISFYLKENFYLFIIFTFLAITSHQSLLFLYLPIFMMYCFENRNKLKINFKYFCIFLVLLIILIFYYNFYYDLYIHKMNGYLNFENIFKFKNYLPSLLLLGISIFNSKKIIIPLILFFPFIFGIALIGPSRLNMLSFIISIYFISQNKGGNNMTFYLLSSYFLYKTIIYLDSIHQWGHGFNNINRIL